MPKLSTPLPAKLETPPAEIFDLVFSLCYYGLHMKNDIHPQYFPESVIKCSCGNELKTGSTKEKINVEICSACHPFYTGQKKIIDTAGRVEKFKARQAKAAPKKQAKAKAKSDSK